MEENFKDFLNLIIMLLLIENTSISYFSLLIFKIDLILIKLLQFNSVEVWQIWGTTIV